MTSLQKSHTLINPAGLAPYNTIREFVSTHCLVPLFLYVAERRPFIAT